MTTHIFQAHNMASAVAQVKASLGPDAFILRTRTIRPGGLFSRRKLVEITADVEPGATPAQFHSPNRPKTVQRKRRKRGKKRRTKRNAKLMLANKKRRRKPARRKVRRKKTRRNFR